MGMESRRIVRVSDANVEIATPEKVTHIVPWELLRAAATQDDAELRTAYAALYKEAQGMLAEQERARRDAEETRRFWELLEHPAARQAATVERTRAGGSVLGAVSTYLNTAEGGWPETQQARRYLEEAVYEALPIERAADVGEAVDALVAAAIGADWGRHPSRREP